MDIANLVIRVTNEGLDRATRELRRLQDQAQGAQAANKKFGESIADLNKLALVGFGALTAVVGGSIKTAIDFEKAMAGVAKTVDFATDNGLANMKKGIEDLTKTIPLAFEELAEIASVGGSLGVVEEDILGFTETIAKMGVAFDISAGDAADSMAKIAGVFGIPIAEISALGDSINAVSNSVAASAGDVIDFMKRVGGTSAALKISADNTSALGGAMVALGLTPEVAGTAFNKLGTTLAGFNNLTSTEARGFKRLGLDTVEFADLIQTDAVAAIHQLLGATKELGGTDALTALTEAFGAQGIKILQVAEGLDTVDLALSQVAIGADGVSAAFGSMDAEFASVSSTTANKLQLVQNNMRLLAAGVGEAFLPAVNELILALVPVIEKMTAWAQANPELIVTIAKVTASVLGAIIAMAAISGAIGTVISTFQGLSAIFGVAKIAIMALSGPIGLTVIALGILVAAGALVYQNWDLIKQKATEIWGAITSYIGNKIAEIKNYFSTNFPAMTAIVSAQIGVIKAVVIGGFNLVKNTIQTVLAVIKAVIAGDFGAIPAIIGAGLKNAIAIVGSMMTNILNVIKEAGKKLFNIGRDFIQGFINGIKSVGSSVVSAASGMVGNAIAAVKRKQDSASPSKVTTKLGGDFSQGFINGIKGKSDEVRKTAIQQAQSAIDGVKNSIASLQKQQALFGNSSSLASLMYDIENTDKYKDVSKQLVQQLVDETKALEQMNAKAKATLAIQDRLDALKKSKADAKTGLQDMLGGIEQETPLGKIQAEYEERLAVIEQYEQMHTDMIGVQTEARLAVEKSYMDAKRDLMLTQGEALFGDLAGLAKGFAGEQSGIYKALFAVEKGFAIAQSAIAIQQSIAKAMALGFPQNIPVISQAISQGAGIMSSIKGITAGFKQGGYTGNGGASQVAGVVHGQEYVFDAQSTKRIGVDNLNAMRSGRAANDDSKVNVNIINNSSAKVTASDDGQTITISDVRNEVKRGFTELNNPNSHSSKMVNRNVQAARRR